MARDGSSFLGRNALVSRSFSSALFEVGLREVSGTSLRLHFPAVRFDLLVQPHTEGIPCGFDGVLPVAQHFHVGQRQFPSRVTEGFNHGPFVPFQFGAGEKAEVGVAVSRRLRQ